ncbi:MAG: 50S ribosomal protein L10 [Gammaproteobacteria bacterium]|nr:50S ribosomal protein L10 [Gammaproteobacteria bacterium]MDH3465976.1 50S ribosomal protein L10 [Gammaproteobacteria bacterium]
MSLNLEEKKAVVSAVAEQIANANATILAEYRGLSVAQMMGLRTAARDAGVFVRIVKNTLARRVVEGSQFECLQDHLVGPLALATSEDPVAVAKVLSEFAKHNDRLQIKVGAMNGAVLNGTEIAALAKLPGRDELLAKLVGTLQAPVQKFVSTLNEVPSKWVRTLAAIRDSKQAA